MTLPALEVDNLTKRFSGLLAVNSVSFSVPKGAIVGLIGPNGAGKTTCFNMIAGRIPPTAGNIRLEGIEITGNEPERICAAGLARTFQVVRPLPDMSVLDNVIVGALNWQSSTPQESMPIRFSKSRSSRIKPARRNG